MNKHIIAFTLIAGFITGTANAALIDDFSDGEMNVTSGSSFGATIGDMNGTGGNSETVDSSSFGGGRTVSIVKVSGYTQVSAKVDINNGVYTHNSGFLTKANSTISWADNAGVDLIESLTNNVFALDIESIDQGTVDLKLTISDFLSTSDSVTLLGVGAGINSIAFSSFLGIDFLQITTISLQIIGGPATDLVINSLATSGSAVAAVPAPTVLVLLSVGLVAFGFSRRTV